MNRAGFDRPRSRAAMVRQGLWIVVCVVAATLVVLASLSAVNFTSIVVAKASVYVVPKFTVAYEGLDSNGRLTIGGSVTVHVPVAVENPSQRSLHLYLVTYSGWIRDGPAEAGLNESRKLGDDFITGPAGVMWFFRIFGQSTEITPFAVPARDNRTITFDFVINATSDSARFEAIRNITDYAVAGGATVDSVSWNQYLYLVLTIDGVTEATSPSAPAYLRDIRRIEREIGVNIAR